MLGPCSYMVTVGWGPSEPSPLFHDLPRPLALGLVSSANFHVGVFCKRLQAEGLGLPWGR